VVTVVVTVVAIDFLVAEEEEEELEEDVLVVLDVIVRIIIVVAMILNVWVCGCVSAFKRRKNSVSDANKNKDYTQSKISFCPPSSLADSKKTRESERRERERDFLKKKI
jgi:hypothetical protein